MKKLKIKEVSTGKESVIEKEIFENMKKNPLFEVDGKPKFEVVEEFETGEVCKTKAELKEIFKNKIIK